jgi:hypothetical protein
MLLSVVLYGSKQGLIVLEKKPELQGFGNKLHSEIFGIRMETMGNL